MDGGSTLLKREGDHPLYDAAVNKTCLLNIKCHCSVSIPRLTFLVWSGRGSPPHIH